MMHLILRQYMHQHPSQQGNPDRVTSTNSTHEHTVLTVKKGVNYHTQKPRHMHAQCRSNFLNDVNGDLSNHTQYMNKRASHSMLYTTNSGSRNILCIGCVASHVMTLSHWDSFVELWEDRNTYVSSFACSCYNYTLTLCGGVDMS